MNKRKLIVSLVGVVLLFGAIAIAGRMRGASAPESTEDSGSSTVVHTLAVTNGPVTQAIPLTGRVVSAERIDLFAEVQGVATYGSHPFKPGNAFRKGEVLLRIDSRELRSGLAASKSQFMAALAQVLPDLKVDFPEQAKAWEEYLLQFDVEQTLPKLPAVEDQQLKLFLTGRNVYASYYSIREREARLSKYTLYAPFTGYVTQANVDQSTLVSPGQPLGEFIKAGAYELEASVALDQLAWLKVGMEVPFLDVKTNAEYKGKLVRINPKVDATSQLVTVYFSLYSSELRSGQYLEGKVEGTAYDQVAVLPVRVLVNDTQVFVVQDGKAVLQPVEVMHIANGEAVVKGLADGTEVVADQKNAAFEGSAVLTTQN